MVKDPEWKPTHHTIPNSEFPSENANKIKANTKINVKNISPSMSLYDVWYRPGIRISAKRKFLGKLRLELSPSPEIFEGFLNKFSKPTQSKTWYEKSWEIEYGILAKAYEVFKKDPQELESITMTAKTKKDLKIHLGVS